MPAETVLAPTKHEGIGAALRCAYVDRANELPKDMSALLDRLN